MVWFPQAKGQDFSDPAKGGMIVKPKISVIIPAYDEQAYFGACLESLKKQTLVAFELIVVDNNSVDATVQIASAYTYTVLSCSKQGISSARNFGAAHATGDIFCFIDADGVVCRRWVEKVASAFAEGKRIDALSGCNFFGGTTLPKIILYNTYNIIVFFSLFIGNHIGRPFVAGNNMAITKQLFLRAGGFPEFVGEDVRLSKQIRGYKPSVAFDPTMIITYSTRRFEKKGFFETLLLWIKSVWKETPESTYREDF
jgi:glycosyltransferase involved in cell wall biosynthesis